MARASTQERRAEIVAALRTVMAERGFAGASVKAIASEAGLSSGLVHYHFRSKEAVLLALVGALVDGLEARVQAQAALPGWPTVDAILRGLLALDAADAEGLACWVQLAAEAQRRPAVQAIYTNALDRLMATLTEALRDAGVVEPAPAAALLVAAVEGIFQVACVAPNRWPVGAAAPTLMRMARGLAS